MCRQGPRGQGSSRKARAGERVHADTLDLQSFNSRRWPQRKRITKANKGQVFRWWKQVKSEGLARYGSVYCTTYQARPSKRIKVVQYCMAGHVRELKVYWMIRSKTQTRWTKLSSIESNRSTRIGMSSFPRSNYYPRVVATTPDIPFPSN